MPVWIEPKGSKQVKLQAYVAYLLEMEARAVYHGTQTNNPQTRLDCYARAGVYGLVATQLQDILGTAVQAGPIPHTRKGE
jgi:hypothetical protein